MMVHTITIQIINELDIIAARMIARDIASAAGFGRTDQARIATAVSELARTLLVANGGEIQLHEIGQNGRTGLEIRSKAHGGTSIDISSVLHINYHSAQEQSKRVPCLQRLMDECEIAGQQGSGSLVICRKWRTLTPCFDGTPL